MSRALSILVVTWACASPAGAADARKGPPPGPVSFGRSSATIEAAIGTGDGAAPETVVLSASGRQMSRPTVVRGGKIRVRVPLVRVPTAFVIVSADEARREVARLVAYPPKDVAWDAGATLYAAGTPRWFDQWAKAVALPVRRGDDGKLPDIPSDGRRTSGRRLLIVGAAGAGDDAGRVLALCRSKRINVLVLEAAWFGHGQPVEATVRPADLARDLSAMRDQKWPVPPSFWVGRRPPDAVLNRWAWIEHQRFPLLEEVPLPARRRRVVLSYVPWQQQLGQKELADAAFLEVLAAASRPARRWLIHPPPSELEAKDRPVLAAAVKAWRRHRSLPPRAYVLDLRGAESPPKIVAAALGHLQGDVTAATPLLVLGDDPLLNGWGWAKLDRKARSSKRRGVIWMSADELPSSSEYRVRLMQKLTQYGVPLTFAEEETQDEPDEDDEN